MSGRRRKRMCPSNDERDRILQAREMGGPPFHLPWRSFAEFFDERVHGAHRADKPFLTYYDESHGATEPVRRVYSYARFGELVERAATVMRERLGLRRGDRVATVLFNHDQTVLVYFAAWTLGVAVVPINIEESTEKKRYILEHSEASVVFCWQDSLDEIRSLLGELPRLREVVAVNDEGFSMPDAGARRHSDAATRRGCASESPCPRAAASPRLRVIPPVCCVALLRLYLPFFSAGRHPPPARRSDPRER